MSASEDAPGDPCAPHPAVHSGGRMLRAAFFTVCGLLILAAAAWVNLEGSRARFELADAGKVAGLLAASLLVMQFALSSRLKVLDRAFGLDRLLRFHAVTGPAAALLVALHPFLVLARHSQLGHHHHSVFWPVWLGVAALATVAVVVSTSVWRAFLELSWEAWRRVHQLTFVAVALAGGHSLLIGPDLEGGWARWFWGGLFGAWAILFVWVKVAKKALLRSRAYRVVSLERAGHDTWNIELEPPEGKGFRHLPGQFAFLRIFGAQIKPEEHPFTISSAPMSDGRVSFTIKESGDFTATVSNVAVGDTATVDGPYGRFSHVLFGGGDLLFIAGGIGITPILSMLRHMARAGEGRRVTLVWGNKAEADILFRDEVEGLAERIEGLRVHHVLSQQDGWAGETGYVTGDVLGRLLSRGELSREVFLCGPPVMMEMVSRALADLGVSRRRIHTERFTL